MLSASSLLCACGVPPWVAQVPSVEDVEAVVMDEEAVGTAEAPGAGAQILRGKGSLHRWVMARKKQQQQADDVTVEVRRSSFQLGALWLSFALQNHLSAFTFHCMVVGWQVSRRCRRLVGGCAMLSSAGGFGIGAVGL